MVRSAPPTVSSACRSPPTPNSRAAYMETACIVMIRRSAALCGAGLAMALLAGDAFAGVALAQAYPRPVRPYMKIPRTPYPEAVWPQTLILLPDGFTMSREWSAQLPGARKTHGPLNTLRQIADAVLGCWRPPLAQTRQEITVRLAFTRQGLAFSEPRITYTSGAVEERQREALRRSILKAITDCTPLRFTPGLASAIAGRPFAIRFIAPAR